MKVSISVDTRGLKPWAKDADRGVKKSAAMAVRDGTRAARTEASRHIRSRKSVKAGELKKMVVVLPSSKDALFRRIRADGARMPVYAFPHRQTKTKGVVVRINKGSRAYIAHGFVAEMKSTHRGVFVRTGDDRLPIKELYTTRVADAFEDAIPASADKFRAKFEETFFRVLPMNAPHAAARIRL